MKNGQNYAIKYDLTEPRPISSAEKDPEVDQVGQPAAIINEQLGGIVLQVTQEAHAAEGTADGGSW